MEYYKLLQLEREPFSNSPDPDYFFQSEQHLGCLQKLELALRLKRGLNVVLGDIGTGKTTLCRQLIRNFAVDDGFESHLILDPAFDTPLAFLRTLYELFYDRAPKDHLAEGDLKEAIQQHLFTKGVDENKTIALIIDEGQKITNPCVEILRELLNYETNTFKLLQIVIFAQLEFEEIMTAHANFADRINLLHHLAPMNFKDTRRMVQHRIKLSSTGTKPKQLFTLPAMWAIYRSSKGYPRKIIHLCHQSMLAMLIQNKSRAGWAIILSCKKRLAISAKGGGRTYVVAGGVLLIAFLVLIGFFPDLLPVKQTVPPPKVPEVESIPPAAAPDTPNPAPMVAASHAAPLPNSASNNDLQDEALPSVQDAQPSAAALQERPESEPAISVAQPIPEDENLPERIPPEIMGQLIVQPGDTLEQLASAVYGNHRNSQLRAVIASNPHIEDPNTISIGDIVRFPSIEFEPVAMAQPSYWIILFESPSLPSAMQLMSDISQTIVIPLQIIPHWHPESGLLFSLIIEGYFDNKAEALSYTRALPESLMQTGRVVSDWPDRTLYFADPYEGGRLNSPINDVRQRLEE